MKCAPYTVTGLALALAMAACPLLAQAASKTPGEVFQDCKAGCPEMVVLPAGSFVMGTPDD